MDHRSSVVQLRHHELIRDSYRVTTSSATLILREPSAWNTVALFRPIENYHLVTILGVRHYQLCIPEVTA